MSQKDEKKEKVIHTRISETLEQELKARASGLGVSVSNLVRNVLLSTFGLMDGMGREGAAALRSHLPRLERMTGHFMGEHRHDLAEAAAEPESPQNQVVIGWQTFFLAVNSVCSECNALLPRGSDACIGVTEGTHGIRPILCLPCLHEQRKPESSPV